jgi:hypothetical protein
VRKQMQIVIDIPNKIYESVQDGTYCGTLYEELKNGTLLPKGHGRLIDADKTILNICGRSCGCHLEECGNDYPCFSVTRISSAQTIIEADKEQNE